MENVELKSSKDKIIKVNLTKMQDSLHDCYSTQPYVYKNPVDDFHYQNTISNMMQILKRFEV